ncbi:helix-turn-helix domain-containing protein [Peribacillus loiseleuriae]|uniref:helix-turn-helix domain-containing protein n=1 Tax=Peribacillus loiseleuriae TaxID=1679170 RepID=UPI00382E1D42
MKIAANEFEQKGYYGTKVSTIVKRANLPQPTFYLYFQSKEALFQELVDIFHLNLFEYTKKAILIQESIQIPSQRRLQEVWQQSSRIGFLIT